MEHNDFHNHISFKVHARNVLEVYNIKQNHIIQLGGILDETKEIDDDDKPE